MSTVQSNEASVSGNIVLSSQEAMASPFKVLLPLGVTGGATEVGAHKEQMVRLAMWMAYILQVQASAKIDIVCPFSRAQAQGIGSSGLALS